MNRRTFLNSLGVSTLAAQPRKPNVLFLLTDDQRADTIAALGNPAIRTPNLDSLVRRGMAFRNAYCMGGNLPAVCTPSRNMILSGRAYTRYNNIASGNDPNFPDSLKAAGYETYHYGKRGNTATEIQAKFDTNRYLTNDSRAGVPGKAIADGAIDFLNQRKGDRPFFLYLAFDVPHDPHNPTPEDLASYDPREIPLPRNYLPVHPFDNGEMVVRDELLAPWPRTKEEIRHQLHEYYAVITGMDRQIGRILQTLRERGEEENTIIVFAADQGVAIGSHGLIGKQSLYDAAMRAPLVFVGPGIPHGQSEALVYLMDIYPTILDLLSIPRPSVLDGESFRPALEKRSLAARESLFLAYRSFQRGIRDQRYKLILYPDVGRRQLFDLRKDPNEIRDLASQQNQQSRIAQMTAKLEAWQQRLNDPLPLVSANPKPAAFTPPTGEALAKLRKQWRME